MHAGLVGWVSHQHPRFSFGKSFCTTDRCVVQIFSELFFLGKNKGTKKKAGKRRIALRWTLLPSQGERRSKDFFMTTNK